MTDNNVNTTKVQYSTKIAGDMLNFYAASVDELDALLGQFAEKADSFRKNAETISQVALAAATQQTITTTVAAPAAQGNANSNSNSAPVNSGPPNVPSCNHGPRVWKTGTSSKGAWKAWMCGAQQNDPTKCSPEWVK